MGSGFEGWIWTLLSTIKVWATLPPSPHPSPPPSSHPHLPLSRTSAREIIVDNGVWARGGLDPIVYNTKGSYPITSPSPVAPAVVSPPLTPLPYHYARNDCRQWGLGSRGGGLDPTVYNTNGSYPLPLWCDPPPQCTSAPPQCTRGGETTAGATGEREAMG